MLVGLQALSGIWFVISDEGPEVFGRDVRWQLNFVGLWHLPACNALGAAGRHQVLRARRPPFRTPSPEDTGVV